MTVMGEPVVIGAQVGALALDVLTVGNLAGAWHLSSDLQSAILIGVGHVVALVVGLVVRRKVTPVP